MSDLPPRPEITWPTSPDPAASRIDDFIELSRWADAVERYAANTRRPCGWVSGSWRDGNNLWYSDCGHVFEFDNGGPVDNGFKHCPYCGLPLQEK